MNGRTPARLSKARRGAWRIAQIAAADPGATTEEAHLNHFVTVIELC